MAATATPSRSPGTWLASAFRSPLLLRAVAEFALIVCSVLVALWVSNWNTQRDRAHTERVLLASLGAALRADYAVLARADSGFRVREQRLAALVEHLRSHRPYTDTLRVAMGAVYGLSTLTLNRAPYEGLKALDLSLVQDDSLRTALTDLYDRAYLRVENVVLAERTINEELRPYYLGKFRDLTFLESATPLDPPAVMRDPLYLNLVEYRLVTLRSNLVGGTERTMQQVQETLSRLDAYLRTVD